MRSIERRLATLGRAPLSEWEELARAAAPPPPGLVRWLADHLLWVLLVPHLALLVALVARAPLIAVLCWLLAAVLDWAATRVDSPLGRLFDYAGLKPQLRAALRSLLLLGALAPLPVAVPYACAVVAVQLAWTALGGLAALLWRAAPPLRYLPGQTHQAEPLRSYVACYAAAVGAPGALVLAEAIAVLGAVPGVFGPTSMLTWLAVVAPVVGALFALFVTARSALAVRRLLHRKTADTEILLSELTSGDPHYLVYVSAGAGQSRSVVNQWLPVFDATPHNGVMVVREASQLKPLAATRLPVVYAPTTRGVELLTLESIKAALYLAYGEKNVHLLRDQRLKHVMLGHGDSDKASSANPQARAYDQVWVAGPAAVGRFRAAGIDLPDDRFVLIGRPQAEPLLAGVQRDPGESPVVLYAPTFEGYYEQTAYSSLDTMGPAMVRRLLEVVPRVRVWFKPHPASGTVRPSMLAAIAEIEGLLAGGEHVLVDHTDLTLVDCLAQADVLLADVSSVTSDFLATGRPAIVTNPAGLTTEEFLAAYPSQRGLYLVGPGLAGFDQAVRDAFGPDPLRAERLALRSHLLGDHPDGPQAAFDAALARLTS
ncbi:MAG: CDP-glycerol glycerophosphotransferase family protein [Propionicimonas sp.]|uniref:CDP-glycerol glycerophosphotransferase family protein n=1 Tax=Propionicimonas sp. TaxID=1955623 RepID=UPI002B2036D2|nr:CDP-glycerol glycerophosphotransferase family protein [Propionicimonas sp.]MEA4945132.1 CDP-glycerol glycerophosphotransferase family protein [Propionicimonas sp.]